MSFHFENRINSYIHLHRMILPGDSTLVAVSGGQDSMCLAYLLHKLQFRIAIAHVNYKLRGEESDLDEKFLQDWCHDHDISFHCTSFNTKLLSVGAKKGIQETARQLRYTWFGQLSDQFHYTKIATAHHLDDQAETILFNLLRGSGIQGAKGIPVQHGNVIRPLLSMTKMEISAYVQDQKIPYREDLSNQKTEYSRNKIRHQILPLMQAINHKASEHIGQFGLRLQRILPAFEIWKKEVVKKYTLPSDYGILLTLPEDLDTALLFILLQDYGFNESQVEQIYSSIQNGEKGKHFLSQDYQLFTAGASIEIQKKTALNPLINTEIENLPFKQRIGSKELCFEWVPSPSIKPDNFQIDLRNYSFPLTLRTWTAGDCFSPSGMDGHSKKIHDYLTDLKISGFNKKHALVLLSKNEIIWVWPEGRISEYVKVSENSSRILGIHIQDAIKVVN